MSTTSRANSNTPWIGIGLAVILLLVAVLPLGCERQPEPRPAGKESRPERPVIVAAGDSLTAGFGVSEGEAYPARLERRLTTAGHKYRVINAGASGETSSGLLARLAWLLSLKPAIVIVETGGNDGLRGIDPSLTKDNIRQIIDRLQAQGIIVVLAGMRMVGNLGPQYTAAFDRIYPELARETGVVFLPFFLEGVAMMPALTGSDGIHPNAAGYALVADRIYPYVVQAITDRESARHPEGP